MESNESDLPPPIPPFKPLVAIQDRKFKSLNDPSVQPEMVKIVPLPKLKTMRDKFNSTATLFINSSQSILAPSVSEILKCLSLCLYYKMKESEKIEPKHFIDIFTEDINPLESTTQNLDTTVTPPLEEIHHFLKVIYDTEQLSAECAVMALIFVERLIALTNITLHASNWRRICFGAIIIASKVWEDTAVWNSDFRSVFPKLRLNDLGKLERDYLRLLDFNVAIKSSVYAKYYFSLRTIAERSEINFPLQPLTRAQEQQLEANSHGMEVKAKQFNIHRSVSLEAYIVKDAPVCMEDIKLNELSQAGDKT